MARRKAKTGQLVLVGVLAVGLGYLLGTWALQLLLKDAPAPQPKMPEVVGAEGEEFSQNVAEVPARRPVSEKSALPAPEQKVPAVEENKTLEELTEESQQTQPQSQTAWRVVVGNFATRQQQEEVADKLAEAGFEVLPKGDGPYYIQMGVFQEKQRADDLAAELRGQGYSARVEGITL